MNKKKLTEHVNYKVSKQGGSLKVAMPSGYCKRKRLSPGSRISVRDYGGDCLIVGNIEDIYALGMYNLYSKVKNDYE